MSETPIWLADNPFIQRLLTIFIDQCDKPNTVRFQKSINNKSAPELFDHNDPNTPDLWPLIESKLYKEFKVIQRIQYGRVPLMSEKYEKAIIYFNQDKESLVRTWLNRPKEGSYSLQWYQALKRYPLFKNTTLNQAIKAGNTSAEDILEGFSRVKNELNSLLNSNEKISLRGLSARCFWGDSKFLDTRRELLEDVFSQASLVIKPRALMLSAYIPKKLQQLIFVENFDCFLSTVAAIQDSLYKDQIAVVYSAGYRGSAHLIRTPKQCQFVSINSVEPDVFNTFNEWWFKASNLEVKTWFWGDLDYEGMRILTALRHNFPNTQAWQLAYDLMLEFHRQGLGHTPTQANKQAQKIPDLSGCNYADQALIPLLIKTERFIDQEVVSQAQLLKALNLTHKVDNNSLSN